MSHMDVGKEAKRQGVKRPRDARKLEPEPPASQVPGKAVKRKKVRKMFGFTYQQRLNYMGRIGKWKTVKHWGFYETAKQRDSAMKAAGGGLRTFYEVRNVLPMMRGNKAKAERRSATPSS